MAVPQLARLRNGSGTYPLSVLFHSSLSVERTTLSSFTSQARWRRPCSSTCAYAMDCGARGLTPR